MIFLWQVVLNIGLNNMAADGSDLNAKGTTQSDFCGLSKNAIGNTFFKQHLSFFKFLISQTKFP